MYAPSQHPDFGAKAPSQHPDFGAKALIKATPRDPDSNPDMDFTPEDNTQILEPKPQVDTLIRRDSNVLGGALFIHPKFTGDCSEEALLLVCPWSVL